MIIGITGSIGSGKTTAARLFSRHLYNGIDADEIAHEILKSNKDVKKILIKNFGSEILGKNKNIDRKKLNDVVFNNHAKLKKLNSIMHPLIVQNIKNEISRIKKQCRGKARIVVDAPLLLETKTKSLVDKIIVVKCSKKNISERSSNKYPKQKIERILKLQMPLNEKLKHADFIVDNNNNLRHLENQVMDIIKKLEYN